MTREEEIKQAAKNRADQYEHPVDWNNCYHHYIQGAKWADQHPREGLWNAEKVISFLKEHATVENSSNINIHINGAYYHFVNDFIEDLRKAMEN